MSHKGTVFFQQFKVIYRKTKYALLKKYIYISISSLSMMQALKLLLWVSDPGEDWVIKSARTLDNNATDAAIFACKPAIATDRVFQRFSNSFFPIVWLE